MIIIFKSHHLSPSFSFLILKQLEGGGEPFNHDQDYNKEVVMIMIIMIMMIKDKIMVELSLSGGGVNM